MCAVQDYSANWEMPQKLSHLSCLPQFPHLPWIWSKHRQGLGQAARLEKRTENGGEGVGKETRISARSLFDL